MLILLHMSHTEVNKTYDIAKQLYFWPCMLSDIRQQCEALSILVQELAFDGSSFELLGSSDGPFLLWQNTKFLVCEDQWSGCLMFR